MGWLTDAEKEEIRENWGIIKQSDDTQENSECNVNESIYQENASPNNQANAEIPSETGGESEVSIL